MFRWGSSKMERGEGMKWDSKHVVRCVIFHNYATLSGILKIKSYFTSKILSLSLSSQFNMENIRASLRALVSLNCHSLLNKTGMLFPR